MAERVAREIYYKAVFRRGGQPQSAYDETYTFLEKQYGKKLSLFVVNQIERELTIDQTYKPTRKSEKYIIADPKLTTIRDEIASEMRSLPCYHRSSFLCEYLIRSLTVTQPDDRPVHFILIVLFKTAEVATAWGVAATACRDMNTRSAIVAQLEI